VHAALDVDNVPPQAGNGVPPNILFILDDSGSMAFEYMYNPALTQVSATGVNNIAPYTYTSNTIYYDPRINYQTWMTANGSRMTGGTSYGAAYSSFNYVGGDTIDLANSGDCEREDYNGSNPNVCGGNQYFYVPKDMASTNTAYLQNADNYWLYVILEGSGRIAKCERTGPNWDRQWGNCVYATPTGRDEALERQNYATWFSYHRTRVKVAKAGSAEAFSTLDGTRFRVGFTTIWGPNGDGADNAEFLIPVNTDNGLFRNANRTTWYSRLFAARAYNGTPLHGALNRAGQYFEDTGSSGPYGGTSDANGQQFACRQNFAILTTDGLWNVPNSPSGYGNQDGNAGTTITGPNSSSYTYSPTNPYTDGFSNTLADVAMRFWKRDLRTDLSNIVPVTAANPAFWQHMVTFGISIGLTGRKGWSSISEVPADPQWRDPTDTEDNDRIDDLLHAAVNGRGEFVSAANPSAFASGLQNALGAITQRTSSASNVAANSTALGTDTRLFQASYIGGQWTGEVKAFPVTAAGIQENTPVWSASTGIPAAGSRKVFTHDGSAGATFPTAAQQTALAWGSHAGADVAAYLKGDQTKELRQSGGVFRNRNSRLGDIIHSSPAYDASTDTLYVGSNDGMLHAINASSGQERFAYVPAAINMATLRTLSDPNYAHRYFVDGPMTISSYAATGNQRMLVGALGRGGKALYALDVTNPGSFGGAGVKWEAPNALWTAAERNEMGHVIGEPIIAKLNNGKTAAIIGNGFNSTNDTARLLVIDLANGDLIATLPGSSATNNAMFGARGWDSDNNGTVDFVYAGDLQGNLWKYDLRANNENSWDSAFKQGSTREPMFIARDPSGQRQPITGGISISVEPGTFKRWVFFGTGKFIERNDASNNQVQSFYGLRDEATQIGSSPRTTDLVQRTTTAVGTINGRPVRAFEPSTVTMPPNKKGWFVDFAPPAPGTAQGERMVGEPQVVAGVLIFSSIIPSSDPCLPGGQGFINALNAFTGGSVSKHFFDVDGDGQYTDDVLGSDPVGSVNTGVGMNTDGLLIEKILGVGGSGGNTGSVGVNNPAASGRVSWRELVED
jgi:type IV pilus assembly protein PilY1